MPLTPQQVKGRIKNIAKNSQTDARALLRIYAMECFLARLAVSPFRDSFVIKGGFLVAAMVGTTMRSTMDIDASIRNENLSATDVERIVEQIISIPMEDGMDFCIGKIEEIMDFMEYPGIRIHLEATMGKLWIPFKIDISTGDAITPSAIRFEYPLILEKRSIALWSYNLETVLAEKLQTILSRGVLNTRMRDYYDIHVLLKVDKNKLNTETFGMAFAATCSKRGSLDLRNKVTEILLKVENSGEIARLWNSYREKYPYASEIPFQGVMASVKELAAMVTSSQKTRYVFSIGGETEKSSFD